MHKYTLLLSAQGLSFLSISIDYSLVLCKPFPLKHWILSASLPQDKLPMHVCGCVFLCAWCFRESIYIRVQMLTCLLHASVCTICTVYYIRAHVFPAHHVLWCLRHTLLVLLRKQLDWPIRTGFKQWPASRCIRFTAHIDSVLHTDRHS